jgi:uncharacterized membrane protein YfcA
VIGAPELAAIGAGVGLFYGAFGAGGSAFATPLLALAGVPALIAVASPLPATIPAALAGAWRYGRDGHVDHRLALRAILAGLPAVLAGALLSGVVPGPALLVLSALSLLLVGARLVVPRAATVPHAGSETNAVLAAVAVGFSAGLLANSGGILLVPVFLVIAGLGMRKAAGTSLLVAAAFGIPALATHWTLGHIDWRVALLFAVGLVPGTVAGERLTRHLPTERLQRAFGIVLLGFAAWFVARQLMP